MTSRYEWLQSQMRWHYRRSRETFRKDIPRWKWHISQAEWFDRQIQRGR